MTTLGEFDWGRKFERKEVLDMIDMLLEIDDDEQLRESLQVWADEIQYDD